MYSVEGKSILELQRAMSEGEVTSKELVMLYMERIRKYDHDGPNLHSVMQINQDARFIAEAMDRERALKGPRGPLHGIPILLKDYINTKDKMTTSAGCYSLRNHYAADDAFLVKKLREAGAVILGKTNMSEFGRSIATKTVDGYSTLGGYVKNPYDLKAFVAGSSTGSAVAAISSFAAAAVGTECEGSIIWPALHNGCVGVKPTRGTISREGIIPIGSQDTPGSMGRTVEDCAILLGAMVGEGPEDPATYCTNHLVFQDYTQFLNLENISKLRIGINRAQGKLQYTAEQMELFERAIDVLRGLGATIIDGCDILNVYALDFADRPISIHEMKANVNAYLSRSCALPEFNTLNDLILYNYAHRKDAIRYGQDFFETVENTTSGTHTEPKYFDEMKRVYDYAGKNGVEKLMGEHQLDILLCPGYMDIAAIMGYPAILVPIGYTQDGLPFGASFVGLPFTEPVVFKAAYAYEQTAKVLRLPDLDSLLERA